jgi:hypothetical protein
MPFFRLETVFAPFHATRPSRIRKPLSSSVIMVLTLFGSNASFLSRPNTAANGLDVPTPDFIAFDTVQ